MEENQLPDTGAWLEQLRATFVKVAYQRVASSDVEDIVQDAMRVVVEKNIDPASGAIEDLPPLAWCLQTLRNVIGNHYQRSETRRRYQEPESGSEADSRSLAEELDARETAGAIEIAVKEMHGTDSDCARYFDRLIDGVNAGEIAAAEGLAAPVLYRRLYRCRQKLRLLLQARGIDL